MNGKFTSKTYGDVRYVVKDGEYCYLPKDICHGMGREGRNFGGSDMADLYKLGYIRQALFDGKKTPQSALVLDGVKLLCYKTVTKGKKAKRRRAAAFFEWLQAQEEGARNAAPYVPEFVETEQPTESKNCLSEFDATFDTFTAEMKKEIEARERMMEACKSLRYGALKFKEMYQKLYGAAKAKYDEMKARNADLQAQIDELSKSQVDISPISKLRKELAESRALLGKKILKERLVKYYEDNGIAVKQETHYEPTDVAILLKSTGIYDGNLTAESLNRYLMEMGYQSKNAAKEHNPKAATYIIADFLGAEYAIEQHVHKENNQDFNQLQWTLKGVELIIGTMQTTPPALTFGKMHLSTIFTPVARR